MFIATFKILKKFAVFIKQKMDLLELIQISRNYVFHFIIIFKLLQSSVKTFVI